MHRERREKYSISTKPSNNQSKINLLESISELSVVNFLESPSLVGRNTERMEWKNEPKQRRK